jgi:hypothetical protein
MEPWELGQKLLNQENVQNSMFTDVGDILFYDFVQIFLNFGWTSIFVLWSHYC